MYFVIICWFQLIKASFPDYVKFSFLIKNLRSGLVMDTFMHFSITSPEQVFISRMKGFHDNLILFKL